MVILLNYQWHRVDVAHGDTKEYISVHNSRGHSLHGIWGGVHTEHNVSAAWGTEAWKPQALTQAPYDLFYREFLGKIS